jgi:hypothetical protein
MVAYAHGGGSFLSLTCSLPAAPRRRTRNTNTRDNPACAHLVRHNLCICSNNCRFICFCARVPIVYICVVRTCALPYPYPKHRLCAIARQQRSYIYNV